MDEIEMRLAALERAITALAEIASPAQVSGLVEKLRGEAAGAGGDDRAITMGAAEILGQALTERGPLGLQAVRVEVLDAEDYRRARLAAVEMLLVGLLQSEPDRMTALMAAAREARPAAGEPIAAQLARAAQKQLLTRAMFPDGLIADHEANTAS